MRCKIFQSTSPYVTTAMGIVSVAGKVLVLNVMDDGLGAMGIVNVGGWVIVIVMIGESLRDVWEATIG